MSAALTLLACAIAIGSTFLTGGVETHHLEEVRGL